MAENVDDGVFWLPAEFLSDEDDGEKQVNDRNVGSFLNKKNDDVSRAVFSYRSSSETESSDEEEQYFAELTRRVAHSSLELDLYNNNYSFPLPKPKGVIAGGSPQSTLCGCCRKIDSSPSQGSPNSVYVTSQRATWDLLRAAAGEVERMRLRDAERRRFVHQNHNTSLVVPNRSHNCIVGFNNLHHNQRPISHQQLQIAQFEMLRQQQMANQQIHQQQGTFPALCGAQNRGRNDEIGSGVGGNGGNGMNIDAGLCPSAWPPLQRNVKQQQNQEYGSAMRAVFLGNPSLKRERSTGTGVFLPRRIDSPVGTKMKPGAATAIPMVRSNYGLSQQKRNILRTQPQVNHEIRLPQEWTY